MIEFEKLLANCHEVSSYFPDGLVFIGGIAVYIHAINNEIQSEFTRDADFYISLADMSDLRDIEEATPNRRQSKHQFIKGGFEFDVYTERQSSLIVPYDEAIASSVVYGDMRVAGLEHLFVLKLEAFRDRCGSAKGAKDAKDLIRIASIADKIGFDHSLAAPYLGDEHIELLDRVRRGSEITAIAKGNAVMAKKIKSQFSKIADAQINLHKSLSSRLKM